MTVTGPSVSRIDYEGVSSPQRLAAWVAEFPPPGTPQATNPAPSPQPIQLFGPFSSAHGVDYWITLEGMAWFYSVNVDGHPDPDVHVPMSDFLADPGIIQAYRDDVRAQAELEGYP